MTKVASTEANVASQPTTHARIDAALESILKAAGSKLDAYMPVSKDAMREAMRKIMSESYINGSNDNFEAMRGSKK